MNQVHDVHCDCFECMRQTCVLSSIDIDRLEHRGIKSGLTYKRIGLDSFL